MNNSSDRFIISLHSYNLMINLWKKMMIKMMKRSKKKRMMMTMKKITLMMTQI